MKNKFNELKNVLDAIRTCTQPIDQHSDPKSIDDCWQSAFEFIDDLKNDQENKDKLLLGRAEQLQREADAVFDKTNGQSPYNGGVQVGINRIVNLIKRHQSNGSNQNKASTL